MDRQKYNSLIIDAKNNLKLWIRVSFALLCANILLSIFVLTVDTREKTIVVPAGIKEGFWIKGNKVSPSYIEQMANYFSQILLTYNKSNVKSQYDTILKYVDPSFYGSMKAKLNDDIERIKKNDISSAFYPMRVRINEMRAHIEGEQVVFLGRKIVSKKKKQYDMDFKYQGGNLFISSYRDNDDS